MINIAIAGGNGATGPAKPRKAAFRPFFKKKGSGRAYRERPCLSAFRAKATARRAVFSSDLTTMSKNEPCGCRGCRILDGLHTPAPIANGRPTPYQAFGALYDRIKDVIDDHGRHPFTARTLGRRDKKLSLDQDPHPEPPSGWRTERPRDRQGQAGSAQGGTPGLADGVARTHLRRSRIPRASRPA